jgi:hypothetical protein
VDGLDLLRRVTAEAPRWLAPGGHLLVETSEAQAPRAVEAFEFSGLASRVARSEELNATVVLGTSQRLCGRSAASRAARSTSAANRSVSRSTWSRPGSPAAT